MMWSTHYYFKLPCLLITDTVISILYVVYFVSRFKRVPKTQNNNNIVCRAFILKLINYSCSSYPTRASYSSQVDGFRNPMKNELKIKACLEIISNTDASILNMHIYKARKTHEDRQLYLITHFDLNYLMLTLNVTVQLLNSPKQKEPFFF